MADDDWDRRVRLHAFAFLEQLTTRWGTELPWKELARGFEVDGRPITLLGARGIWKPAAMDLPISITTSHRDPYGDTADDHGFLQYKYFGTDPMHPDNRGLRTCFLEARPLVYFRGVAKGCTRRCGRCSSSATIPRP